MAAAPIAIQHSLFNPTTVVPSNVDDEIVVDNFAGGGGASVGIEWGLGGPVEYAINHDPEAIAMHQANHPQTTHLLSSVWDVNPKQLCGDRKVGLAWFSPDCTFYSKARGGKPFRDRNAARRRRGLAWLIPYWMKTVRPRTIMCENVEEFSDWGPLLPNGTPCPVRRGQTFRRWHRQIENLGYRIDMRQLHACDYGAPTTRRRLFIIARCDDQEIVFPEATHGKKGMGLAPYRTAAECIDWSIPCPSIFEPGRDLVPNTLRRIARGIQRYVIDDPNPFLVTLRGTSDSHINASSLSIGEPLRTITAGGGTHHLLVAPSLINTRNGERLGQMPRIRDIRQPYPTVTALGSQGALVTAFLARHYGGHENDGQSLRLPMHTVTTKDHHALVYAFLLKYYGTDQAPHLREPLHTITTKDRFALVTIHGVDYYISDIRMRHLVPRELFRAQSFQDSYIINPQYNGKPLPKTAQVRMCGNSVPPVMAEALVRANYARRSVNRQAA